jgi:LacI family transcriptional regulator
MSTIKDIAREAGVSVTTVSNVIHGRSQRVSHDTVERINTIIRQYDYIPNLYARALVNRSSRIIGVINYLIQSQSISFFQDPFHSELLGGIEKKLKERGYYMMVRTVANEEELFSLFNNWSLDGVILTGLFKDAFFARLLEMNKPIVLLDSYIKNNRIFNIGLDDRNGGFMATQYLINKGHRNIVFASPPLRGRYGVIEERLKGYKAALKMYNIPFSAENVYNQEITMDEGIALGCVLSKRKDITAIFATADIMAGWIMKGIIQSGRRIPEDISIVGFDDIPNSQLISPSLTTICQNIEKKGQIAAGIMADYLEGIEKQPRNITMPINLIERDSVREIIRGSLIMNIMPQTRTHGGQVFPFPRPGEIVYETPLAFIWIKSENIKSYKIEIRAQDSGEIICSAETERNVFVPEKIIPPGNYSWNIYGGGYERGWQDFKIAENAARFIRPKSDEILKNLPDTNQRPRHLFCAADITALRQTRKAELETLRRNVRLALASPLPEPPDYHINNINNTGDMLGYREYFGRHRATCDRDLVALALASVLFLFDGEEAGQAGDYARKIFLSLCSWNPDGACSPDGDWGDEIGLSHARCFPAVFDLLWPRLSEKERNFTGRTIAAYASLCERRLMRLDFLQNPGDSHCGRLPAYLGEAALVLAGTGIVPEETLRRWLDYALDIYGGVFPHFGGPDGGWAEGTFYASSYTKWYLPFFSAVARFSGKNFLDRVFYQNLAHFFVHFAPPSWENHPFGDGYWCLPDDEEWPGFFAQNPFRVYAGRSRLALAEKFCVQLRSPEIFKLHLLDIFLPEMPPPEINTAGEIKNARAFPDAGFVSLHTDIENPGCDTALLARASRFGRVSHQHADQGSFALIHKGAALISPSGYFGSSYGTRHHFEWTQTTLAHNCALIDGQGQPMDFTATGKIISCGEKQNKNGQRGALYTELDLSGAYPQLESYSRSFDLREENGGAVLTVRDKIKSSRPVAVSYLNHALSPPVILPDGRVNISRGGSELYIEILQGLEPLPQITDEFAVGINDGVPPEYWSNAPKQYHLRWDTNTNTNININIKPEHDIIVRYVVL